MNNDMFYVAYYDTRLKCYDCELYNDNKYGRKYGLVKEFNENLMI